MNGDGRYKSPVIMILPGSDGVFPYILFPSHIIIFIVGVSEEHYRGLSPGMTTTGDTQHILLFQSPPYFLSRSYQQLTV